MYTWKPSKGGIIRGVGFLVICPKIKSEKFNLFSSIHFFSAELVGTELVGTELTRYRTCRHRKGGTEKATPKRRRLARVGWLATTRQATLPIHPANKEKVYPFRGIFGVTVKTAEIRRH